MRAVVADTSPINYLVLIDRVDILPLLFSGVCLTPEVLGELSAAGAPESVQTWVRHLPSWIYVRSPSTEARQSHVLDEFLLDPGEISAIALAKEEETLLLIDEAAGRAAALALNIATTGTLGILVAAARRGHLDLQASLKALKQTNFRVRDALLKQIAAAPKIE